MYLLAGYINNIDEEKPYLILDTKDFVEEWISRKDARLLLESGVKIQGLWVDEDGFIANKAYHRDFGRSNGYAIFANLGKKTFKFKTGGSVSKPVINCVVYQRGMNSKVYEFCVREYNNLNEGIHFSVQTNLSSDGKEIVCFELSVYDKHYYREDKGENLGMASVAKRNAKGLFDELKTYFWMSSVYFEWDNCEESYIPQGE